MTHPPLAALLQPDAETAAHLARCADCARLREVLVGSGGGPRYVRGAEVHRGGMGRIWRATDRILGREVLLKELLVPPDWSTNRLRARFEEEARLTARLAHPAIVTVHDLGEGEDGVPFYVMPPIEGHTLAEVIASTPPERRLALVPLVAAVAEAVAYAHARGVVHRDLKPDNVLVGSYGQVVVLDWGLAVEVGNDPAAPRRPRPVDGLTAMGVGTPGYMPPEQAAGAPADPRQDVFALGATLRQALTGEPPWGASGPGTIRQGLAAGVVPALPSGVPPELGSVLARATAVAPEDRHADASGLLRDLRGFLDGRLLDGHRYTAWDRASRWARRHRAVLGGLAAAAFGGALVAVASARSLVSERDRASSALEASLAAQSRLLSQDATTTADALAAGLEAWAVAEAAGRAPRPDTVAAVRTALAAGPAAARLPEVRGWGSWRLGGGALLFADPAGRVVRLAGGRVDHTPLDVGHPWALASTPDGGGWAVVGEAGGAWTVQIGGDLPPARFPSPVPSRWMAWGDRGQLAFVGDDAVAVVDPTGAEVWRAPLPSPGSAVAADAGRVWVGAVDGSVWSAGPAGVEALGRGASPVTALLAGPDGAVFAGHSDGAVRWLAAGLEPRTLTRVPAPVESLERVGDCLGVSPHRAEVVVVSLGPACPGGRWPRAQSGSLRPDGGAILTLGDGVACVRAWDGATGPCLAAGDDVLGAGFVDRRVGYTVGGRGFVIWDAAGGLPGHGGEVVALGAAPGGFWSAGRDGTLRWADPSSGASRAVATLAGGVAAADAGAGGMLVGAYDGEVVAVSADGAVHRDRQRDGIGAVLVAAGDAWTATFDGELVRRGPALERRGGWEVPGGVRGLVALGDGLLTLGADGVARRWSLDGAVVGEVGNATEPIGAAFVSEGVLWLRTPDGTRDWSGERALAGRLVGVAPGGALVTSDRVGLVRVFEPDGALRSAWAGDGEPPRAVSGAGRVLGGQGSVWRLDGVELGRGRGATAEVEWGAWRVTGDLGGGLHAEPLVDGDARREACRRLDVLSRTAAGCPGGP